MVKVFVDALMSEADARFGAEQGEVGDDRVNHHARGRSPRLGNRSARSGIPQCPSARASPAAGVGHETPTATVTEDEMSTPPTQQDGATDAVAEPIPEFKLEVVVLPVTDVDRALSFYQGLGWRLDADYEAGARFRIVQMTPPGSPCSIHIGRGITPAAPGSARNTYLVVSDLDRARADLIGRGVDVSEIFHHAYDTGSQERVPGAASERRSYASFATFSDPDGNSWLLQEVRVRQPGR
ncbi:VOC family protein [Streptomyces fagopyri]|uniref:VOC family protein n=1 Tax=Streptomyces fagopyri TaxID=2662397 RepID=UPI003400F57E